MALISYNMLCLCKRIDENEGGGSKYLVENEQGGGGLNIMAIIY